MTDYAPYKPGRRRYRLVIQANKSSADVSASSLKRFVKRLARAFGFTVLEIQDITHSNGGNTP